MFARARSHPFLLPPSVLAACMELEQVLLFVRNVTCAVCVKPSWAEGVDLCTLKGWNQAHIGGGFMVRGGRFMVRRGGFMVKYGEFMVRGGGLPV
jgi:hypothetical protein